MRCARNSPRVDTKRKSKLSIQAMALRLMTWRTFSKRFIAAKNHAPAMAVARAWQLPTALSKGIVAQSAWRVNRAQAADFGLRCRVDYRITIGKNGADDIVIVSPILFSRNSIRESYDGFRRRLQKQNRSVLRRVDLGSCKWSAQSIGVTQPVGKHLRFHSAYIGAFADQRCIDT